MTETAASQCWAELVFPRNAGTDGQNTTGNINRGKRGTGTMNIIGVLLHNISNNLTGDRESEMNGNKIV
jgi:hypothetical protein